MLAEILVLWVIGIPAAVIAATELGTWGRKRKRELRRAASDAHASVPWPSQSYGASLAHKHLSGAPTQWRRPECLRRMVALRNPCGRAGAHHSPRRPSL